MGRPSAYTPELAAKICEEIATSTRSLGAICDESDELPHPRTAWRWLTQHEEFRQSYSLAREMQQELVAEECIDIADETSNDTITKTSKSGAEYEAPNHEWISRSALRVSTRLKLMEKLSPKKYGARITQALTGPDGGPIETRDRSRVDRKTQEILQRALERRRQALEAQPDYSDLV